MASSLDKTQFANKQKSASGDTLAGASDLRALRACQPRGRETKRKNQTDVRLKSGQRFQFRRAKKKCESKKRVKISHGNSQDSNLLAPSARKILLFHQPYQDVLFCGNSQLCQAAMFHFGGDHCVTRATLVSPV